MESAILLRVKPSAGLLKKSYSSPLASTKISSPRILITSIVFPISAVGFPFSRSEKKLTLKPVISEI